jgi:hypothetical protein
MALLERDNEIAPGQGGGVGEWGFIVLFRIDCNRYKTTMPLFNPLVKRAGRGGGITSSSLFSCFSFLLFLSLRTPPPSACAAIKIKKWSGGRRGWEAKGTSERILA